MDQAMTIDHEVQKRVAAIVEKAAKARGQRYEVQACEAAIHAMHEEGAISADYRDLLLARVGNLLVPWSAESVENYRAETERQIAAGGLTPTDIAELGLVLLQLVERRLVTADDALAMQAKALVALLAAPPTPHVTAVHGNLVQNGMPINVGGRGKRRP